MKADTSPAPVNTSRFSAAAVEEIFSRYFKFWLGALAVGSAAVAARVSSTTTFMYDDFLNLGEAREKGLSLRFLFEPVTGSHIMPVHRFLNWFVVATGTSHWMAVALTSLSLAAAMVLLALLVREVGGSAVIAILVGAIFATSIVALRVSLWWAEAEGEFPAIALTCAAAIYALKWDGERTTRNLVLACSFYVLAIFAFDKYVTVVIPIVALVVLARPAERGITFSAVRERAVDCAELIRALLGIAVAYGVISLLLGAGGTKGSQSTGFFDYISKMTWSGIAAPLVNGNPSVKASDAIGLAVLALLALGTIRCRRAGWLWLVALLTIAANVLVLAVGRLNSAGLVLVIDPRYQDITLLTLAMLVPAAWFISGRPHPKPGLAFNLSTAAVVIVAVAWGIRGHNALNVQRIVIQTDPAVRYKKTLNSSLASLKAKSAAIALLDAPAPSFLTGPFVAAPYNGTANVTGVLASTANLNVDQLAAQNRNLHPFVITGDGTAKLIVTSPSTFGLIGQPHCVVSKPDAKYTDGFNVPVLLPKPAAASFKPLVIAAALNTSNGTGRISMTATGRVLKWGVSFSDHALADHLRGVGAIAPAGSEAIVINASAGAAFCVTQVGVAPIIGYEAPR